MAALVSLSELKLYLGITDSANDTLLQALLDDVQSIFESATGRQSVGFIPAGSGRIEVRDGTGSRDLWVDYPISVLTSVKLGNNSASPDETLSVSDKNVLVFGVGARRLSRTDGGSFGRHGQPRYIEITYDHSGDMPQNAHLAIKSVAASTYRRRGSEEVQQEMIGNYYSRTLIDEIATQDPYWQQAVWANMMVQVA